MEAWPVVNYSFFFPFFFAIVGFIVQTDKFIGYSKSGYSLQDIQKQEEKVWFPLWFYK